MSGHDYSSDNDLVETNLPAGLRSRGGWEDSNNIEMEHEKQATKRGLSSRNNHAAVDLSQFRNDEVGKGYKAKHVVRQRDATVSNASVIDMSGGKFSKPDSRTKRHSDGTHQDNEDRNRREPYLESKGIRDFLREIEKILKPRE
jgi:hypothetical protein